MKTKILILWILLSQLSCDYNHDNNSIRPICSPGNYIYYKKDFIDFGSDIQSRDIDLNFPIHDIAVHLVANELELSETNFENYFFELKDGKLEIINRGEFGGSLSFIPSDPALEKKIIVESSIDFVFEYKSKIYFIAGSSHGYDQGGIIFELIREKEEFKYSKKLDLDSAPKAMAIYRDKILIAGCQMFTIIEDFKKDNIIENSVWQSLHANSIAIKNENEVYVGMRGGYAKLSMKTKKIAYYRYTGD